MGEVRDPATSREGWIHGEHITVKPNATGTELAPEGALASEHDEVSEQTRRSFKSKKPRKAYKAKKSRKTYASRKGPPPALLAEATARVRHGVKAFACGTCRIAAAHDRAWKNRNIVEPRRREALRKAARFVLAFREPSRFSLRQGH